MLHEEAEEANAKPKCKTEKDRGFRLNARTAGIVHTILHTDIHVSIQICVSTQEYLLSCGHVV